MPWPPKVPWWRPTTMRLQCPHCAAPLRDRHAVQLPGWLIVSIFATLICVQLFATGWLRLLIGLPLLALYAPLIHASWSIRKDADNPHRFVPGNFRFWAQGNEKLRQQVEDVRQTASNWPR